MKEHLPPSSLRGKYACLLAETAFNEAIDAIREVHSETVFTRPQIGVLIAMTTAREILKELAPQVQWEEIFGRVGVPLGILIATGILPEVPSLKAPHNGHEE